MELILRLRLHHAGKILKRHFNSEKPSDVFPCTLKRKVGVFKLLRFEERFPELRFHDGLMWTVGLTVENQAVF